MEADRKDSKHVRTSALGDSWAYASAIATLYTDYFGAWCARMSGKRPARPRAASKK
jgi:hypothetical protein